MRGWREGFRSPRPAPPRFPAAEGADDGGSVLVTARVPRERAKAGFCRGQAVVRRATRVNSTTLVPSWSSSGACFQLLDFRVPVRKGPPAAPRLALSDSLAPPRLVLVSPSHPPGPAGAAGAGTGRGTRQGGTWKNHPDCIAVGEAAGGAGSPEPPPCGAFSVRGSQVLRRAGSGRCGLAGVRGQVPGPPPG